MKEDVDYKEKKINPNVPVLLKISICARCRSLKILFGFFFLSGKLYHSDFFSSSLYNLLIYQGKHPKAYIAPSSRDPNTVFG